MALRTTIAEADWKQPSEPTDPAVAGIQLVREVSQINAINEAGIMATLNATVTITDPKCDGITYTGTYYLSDLESIAMDGGDFAGSITIREKLTKIWTITVVSDLPIKIQMLGKDIVNAFSLSSSVEDFIAYQWLYLNPANVVAIEALNISTLLPSGYTEVKRRVDIEERGNRTATLNVLYKKTTQTAWGGAPDVESWDNYGYLSGSSKGEKTLHTREWYGIQNSDQTTAMTALLTGTGYASITTGYIIMDVTVRDQQDGGLTLIQREIQQVNGVSVLNEDKDDPLGLQTVTITHTDVIYENFTATGLSSAVGSGAAHNNGYSTTLMDNGLYRRVYRNSVGTYPNTLDVTAASNDKINGLPIFRRQYAEEGTNTIALAGNKLHYLAPGVDVDNMDAVIKKANTIPFSSITSALDSTVSVVSVNSQIGSSGDVTINQTLAKINTDVAGTTKDYVTTTGTAALSGAYLLERGKNISGQFTTLKRMWPAVTVANAVILCKSEGEAVKNVTFENEPYKHTNATIAYDMSTGLCDVIQDCDTGHTNTNGLAWWLKTGTTDIIDQRHHIFNGDVYLVVTQQKLSTDTNAIKTYMTMADSNIGGYAWLRLCPEIGQQKPWGTVTIREDTVYDARRVWFAQTVDFVKDSDTPQP